MEDWARCGHDFENRALGTSEFAYRGPEDG